MTGSTMLKRTLSLMLVGLCTGCGCTETLWKYSLASPSGKFTVLAQTDNTDTIGNVEYTIVSVKEMGSWKRPVPVISFDGGVDEESDFKMIWDAPSHVSITVQGYSPTPVPFRSLDGSPVAFSIKYVQKQRQPNW